MSMSKRPQMLEKRKWCYYSEVYQRDQIYLNKWEWWGSTKKKKTFYLFKDWEAYMGTATVKGGSFVLSLSTVAEVRSTVLRCLSTEASWPYSANVLLLILMQRQYDQCLDWMCFLEDMCTFILSGGFVIAWTRRSVLACSPRELITRRECCQITPKWEAHLLWSWLKKNNGWTITKPTQSLL